MGTIQSSVLGVIGTATGGIGTLKKIEATKDVAKQVEKGNKTAISNNNKMNDIESQMKANAERMANLEDQALTQGEFQDYIVNKSYDDFKRNMAIHNQQKIAESKKKQKAELESRHSMLQGSENNYEEFAERGSR